MQMIHHVKDPLTDESDKGDEMVVKIDSCCIDEFPPA